MKAKLIFDVPEERKAFMAAVKADDMAFALWNINYNLRKRAEDHFDTLQNAVDGVAVSYDEVLDFIFKEIQNEMDEQGIIIDDLTE